MEGDATRPDGLLGVGPGVSSCCMDRGNCSSRERWRIFGSGAVGLLYVDVSAVQPDQVSKAERVGFHLIAGEGNVQHSPPTIRTCEVADLRVCP